MGETTRVEIVIPVHNRREITLQALHSLSRISSKDLKVHIIVVDDGSTDGTFDAVHAEFPDVQLVTGDGTLHYAAGTNRGITAALEHDPDYLVLCNDDSIFHSEFLQKMVATARAHPNSIVGAALLLWTEPHLVFQIGFTWKTLGGGWQQIERRSIFDLSSEPFEVEGLAGNCVLIPAKAVLELGLMDEVRFPHGWGDIQYFVKLKKAGWNLLVDPRALVWCEPNTNAPPLHSLNLSQILTVLFKNRRHPLNLHRQFVARWESAPSRVDAATAFLVFLGQLARKSVRHALKR